MTGFAISGADSRIGAVDCAKGISIILVVMMHSTLGVGEALGGEGFLHPVIAFAQPFRVPAFFLIAGLFIARSVAQPWSLHLDGRILNFAWLYLLWLVIQLGLKSEMSANAATEILDRFMLALVEPMGTLWFIYMLPLFFVATKLLHRLSPVLVLAVSTWLNIVPGETGWLVPDEFAERFVYFYVGYLIGTPLLANTVSLAEKPKALWPLLAAWAAIHGAALTLMAELGVGLNDVPGAALALGLAGAVAVLMVAALLARLSFAAWLAFVGRNSLVIYLAFFLPMASARLVIAKLTPGIDIGLASLLVTSLSVALPILLVPLSQTGLSWLFRRPDWLIRDQIAIEAAHAAETQPANAAAQRLSA